MGSVMDQERPWERRERIARELAAKEKASWQRENQSGLSGSETQSSLTSSVAKGEPMTTATSAQNMSDTKSSSHPASSKTDHRGMDAKGRKDHPLFSGVMRYFPDALLEVAELSRIGNEQHNPGQPLHWAKEKSTDEMDALMRHALDVGTRDTDGVRHSAKVAWRALANLQREIERERA